MDALNRRDVLRLAALGTATSTLALSTDTSAAEIARDSRGIDSPAGVFEELPVGSVRPQGWLLTQLHKQAEGVTSHLQHLYEPFSGNAWLADETNPKASWWPWEVRGYWCDGTLRCGLLLDHAALIEQTTALIKYTFSHPGNDGYLGPNSLREAGDSNRWPHAVFFRAAMAYYDATRDPMIVEGLSRHYLESKFNYIADRATTNIEAMLWTYDRTGDRRLLQLAEDSWARSQKFLAMNDGSFGLTELSWLSPGPCREVHGVTYAELSKIPIHLYRATREERYLKAAIGAQRKIFEHHLLVGGVPSTSETLAANSSRDAHEVCNAIDFPWTWGYLLMASGDGMYGDRIERATFNGLPGSLKKDWKALQYYSSPNQFICTELSDHVAVLKGTGHPTIKEWRYMQRMSYRPSPGHSVVCCPGNLSRALPNYISRMWMADRRNNGLAATLYGPGTVKWPVGSKKTEVQIHTETSYPYSDEIVFKLQMKGEIDFPLHLRIPGWCSAPRLVLNGNSISLPPLQNGFVKLARTWRTGDVLRLKLPMTIATTRWPEEGVSIERGPLVYALPIQQQWTKVADERSSTEFPAWDLHPTGQWNYALLPDTDARKPAYTERPVSNDPWMDPPSSITVNARTVDGWTLTRATVHGEEFVFTPRLPDPTALPYQLSGPEQQLKLVPYASTELRVAIFPKLKTELI